MSAGVASRSSISSRRLGVCSWSLRPKGPDDLALQVRATGCRSIQLALAPLRAGETASRWASALDDAGITVLSCMMSTLGEDYTTLESIRRTGGVRPDATWDENQRIARDVARLAARFHCRLVTFHAGFLPHERDDAERAKLVGRLRTIVDVFADQGVRVGFETGQETAETLLDVLDELDRPTAGVNFDPANMILYGMGDPVAALEKLGPRVHQVHVKDARASNVRGEWGTEVRVGTGQVDWRRFFQVLDRVQPGVDLVIEREAGSTRVADVIAARAHLESIGVAFASDAGAPA